MELFSNNDKHYIWRKMGEPLKPHNTIPNVKYGGGIIMLWAALLQSGLV